MFNFLPKEEANKDRRCALANLIFQNLYLKNNKDLEETIIEAKPYFELLDDNLRNLYELVDNSLPLMAYYELKTFYKDNWTFTNEEYEQAFKNTIKACEDYYSN